MPGPADPVRNRNQALNALELASRTDHTEISPVAFVEDAEQAGPEGITQGVIAAVVDMKRRNPTWGCPRIAQQIALAFGVSINKDVVRRILAGRQPVPESAGPSWLTMLGHTKDSLWSLDLFDVNRPLFGPTGC